jgi:hypothetical protein
MGKQKTPSGASQWGREARCSLAGGLVREVCWRYLKILYQKTGSMSIDLVKIIIEIDLTKGKCCGTMRCVKITQV